MVGRRWLLSVAAARRMGRASYSNAIYNENLLTVISADALEAVGINVDQFAGLEKRFDLSPAAGE